jgi:trans-aconitate 2-methyltransferase
MADTWDPGVYEQFKAERDLPFHDLLALVHPVPGGRTVDLGCGTGELTSLLHVRAQAAETVGIDASAAMLERSAAHAGGGLRFELGDLAALEPDASWDVVLANASLQWVGDHPALFARLRGALAPGGQLAVQMPANFDHPSHVVADEIGSDLGMAPLQRFEAVLAPDAYALLLDELGFVDQHVRLQVYVHHLPSTASVIDWVSGSLLTRYRRDLGDRYETFLARYRTAVLAALGDPMGAAPFTFTFKRLLLWGRAPA